MSTVTRPTKPCTNPRCGNTVYEAAYARNIKPDAGSILDFSQPVWECMNCHAQYPRACRRRRSNGMRACDAVREIKVAWESTDKALQALVDAGLPSGCLLVHSSTWNYHLDSLRGLHLPKGRKHLSNFDIRYHTKRAYEDLATAKKFVEEKRL